MIKRVVLLKSFSPDYQTILNDFELEFVPVLDFEYINHDQLAKILSNPVQLITTSTNALEAIKKLNLNTNCTSVFVVGQKTFKMALEMGLLPIGEKSGNADALAKFIIDNQHELIDKSKPLVWLRGNLADSSFNSKLEAAGIQVTSLVVYNTINIPIPIINDAIVVVFSPSGFSSVERFENCTFISFGPTTYSELLKQGIESTQAKEPTPQGVLLEITELVKRGN